MEDKEKAEWIANSYDGDEITTEDVVTACLGMARWKEEQIINEFCKLFCSTLCNFKTECAKPKNCGELEKIRQLNEKKRTT